MKKIKLLGVAATVCLVSACSQYGFYAYESPFTYDPTDPDYQTITNVHPSDVPLKTWSVSDSEKHTVVTTAQGRTAGTSPEWEEFPVIESHPQAPARVTRQTTTTVEQSSVTVYPLD